MHFKNQHGLIVRGEGNVLEIKAFAGVEWLADLRGTPEKPSARHRQSTVDRR
jgi:hypothetical protein